MDYTGIEKLIKQHNVVLFMKGTEDKPACGFSKEVVDILHHLGVNFYDVNVLDNPELRQNLKTFSHWPTFPQLYAKGNFIGGCDIVKEMYQNNFDQLKLALDMA